jgi:RNA polymerase sigma factor (sigma-70 family)
MSTDVELVERCRRRDADAFGALVTRHQQLVFGVALARCQDPALAEDVAQEAFVAAWRDLDRLRDANRVGSWVAGIARNLAANAVRARARRERNIADDPVVSDVPTPEDAALAREDRELLARALTEIPETHRETLVLFYLQGQSVAEIASALEISEDLVKQRLSRARRAVRESVAERVESVLTRTRLRPAFRAGVVAALTVASSRKAAAGKVITVMSVNKIALTTVAVGAVAAGALYFGTRSNATPPPQAAPTPQTAAQPRATTSPTTNPTTAPKRLHVERLPDKAARATLLAAIEQARKQRASTTTAAAGGASAAPSLPSEVDDYDKQYIRSAVKEIIPLLMECYEQGLERDPKLEGRILVEFTIDGEPDVGGIVSSSAIDPKESTLADNAARECMQETMYALKIDPPTNGGTVNVRYPFIFAPRPPEETP